MSFSQTLLFAALGGFADNISSISAIPSLPHPDPVKVDINFLILTNYAQNIDFGAFEVGLDNNPSVVRLPTNPWMYL